MPPPFNQGWVGNIRKLAAAKWWDGTSVNRVQDNYVVQWGDATEKKALPEGLANLSLAKTVNPYETEPENPFSYANVGSAIWTGSTDARPAEGRYPFTTNKHVYDAYGSSALWSGWPVGLRYDGKKKKDLKIIAWPVHCYGMVGVGRNLSPDTGTGAELYTVIGHAPRHLDRNIALVGRVIEGIEHLSSLPRGTGGLGFYEKEEERVPILSVRMGNDVADLPAFVYLSTESASFAAYADARANRRDPFFNVPAGGADICNIPVPVRRRAAP
jgi:cyclophilin family peptidyl-prolyl cis-trans isomerase